ncbi:MAG: hypothetical protein ACYS8K_05020 [Planctomycetota bacterium]|jgi:hypothetical protein
MLTLILGGSGLAVFGLLLFSGTHKVGRSVLTFLLLFGVLTGCVLAYSYYKAGQCCAVVEERLVSRHPVDLKSAGVNIVAGNYVLLVPDRRGIHRKKLPVDATTIVRSKYRAPCLEVYDKVLADDPDAGSPRPRWYFRLRRSERVVFSHYVLVLPPGEPVAQLTGLGK